jgi:hypothetical protein
MDIDRITLDPAVMGGPEALQRFLVGSAHKEPTLR